MISPHLFLSLSLLRSFHGEKFQVIGLAIIVVQQWCAPLTYQVHLKNTRWWWHHHDALWKKNLKGCWSVFFIFHARLLLWCQKDSSSQKHDSHHPIEFFWTTAVAHILGHKYRILGHSLLCSIYETKNGFGKNMACLWSFVADNKGPLWTKVIK